MTLNDLFSTCLEWPNAFWNWERMACFLIENTILSALLCISGDRLIYLRALWSWSLLAIRSLFLLAKIRSLSSTGIYFTLERRYIERLWSTIWGIEFRLVCLFCVSSLLAHVKKTLNILRLIQSCRLVVGFTKVWRQEKVALASNILLSETVICRSSKTWLQTFLACAINGNIPHVLSSKYAHATIFSLMRGSICTTINIGLTRCIFLGTLFAHRIFGRTSFFDNYYGAI